MRRSINIVQEKLILEGEEMSKKIIRYLCVMVALVIAIGGYTEPVAAAEKKTVRVGYYLLDRKSTRLNSSHL